MKPVSRRLAIGTLALSLAFGTIACSGNTQSVTRSADEREDDMAIGNPAAPVTLIEYASSTCPHCAVFHETVLAEIKTKYVETDQVRFIFRQFPTPPARFAIGVEALARCKGDTDSYFQLLDTFFERQKYWLYSQNPGQAMRDISATVGITPAEFDACVVNETILPRIQEVGQHASDTWGIQSTPQFVINGEHTANLATFEDFANIIDPILAGKDKK